MPAQPPTPGPRLDVRGAIDLSALARSATPSAGTPGGLPAAGAWVRDVDPTNFAEVVQASTSHPVVVALWASWSQASRTVVDDLGALAQEDAGRWLLARVDAEANPQIAQAFGAQSVPVVVAMLGGRPLPLFEGQPDRTQMRGVIDQVLEAASANGITGTVASDEQPVEAPEEPPLPPLHQEAYDAIARDDLDAAREAYDQAIKENPRDDEARAGLAQVGLLARTRDVADPAAARQAAAGAPGDIAAQLVVADLDVAGGHVDDAFSRLIGLVRTAAADERDRVRVRLLELFEVVGGDDPRVVAARRALTSALY